MKVDQSVFGLAVISARLARTSAFAIPQIHGNSSRHFRLQQFMDSRIQQSR